MLYGDSLANIKPDTFDYNMSIEILVIVVLGGMGSIRGSIIAAIILRALPEMLRGLEDYRMLIYSVLLIIIMLLNASPKFAEFKGRWSVKNMGKSHCAGFLTRTRRQRRLGKMSEIKSSRLVPYPSGAFVPERDVNDMPVLETRHLGIDFGGLTAVDDFSIAVGETRELPALSEPNGAGKTTVFNLLTNVYQPTRGNIMLNGYSTEKKSTAQVSKMGIARTFFRISACFPICLSWTM